MSNKIWYLPGPFHQYNENVKALAKEHGLRIIDANVTASRNDEADRVPEVTLREVFSPAPVLPSQADDGELLEKIGNLNAERDGVLRMIEAAEGVTPLEHPGAGELPIRLFHALKAIHDGVTLLESQRNDLATENESQRVEIERLKAAADQSNDDTDKVAALKAQLDKAGVTYRANASVESLEKAVAELPKA